MFPFARKIKETRKIYVPESIINEQIEENLRKQREIEEKDRERRAFIEEQRRFINEIQIEEYIPNKLPSIKEFHTQKNTLEAIVLLTTSREINSKVFSKFITNLVNVMPNRVYDIDFVISVNNLEFESIQKDIIHLQTFFNTVKLINTNIDPKNDVYSLDALSMIPVPKYGLTAGPNILYYETMKKMKTYNTVLVLETDCILYDDWLDTLINYVKYSGDFLISGSTYDGVYRLPSTDNPAFFHINGVALYKTGSPVFQFILDELMRFIVKEVKSGNVISAYDYMFSKMIFSYLADTKTTDFDFWKTVYRYVIKNTFIINASMPCDKNQDESFFLNKFPRCVILHKKSL